VDGREGKVTITDKVKKKLEDFKKSLTTEEKNSPEDVGNNKRSWQFPFFRFIL
jgi:hypothetical protein